MKQLRLALVVLVACGGGDDDGGDNSNVDAPPAPQTIMVSGVAQTVDGTDTVPLEGATIEAFRSSGGGALATTTSAADGTYSLTLETGGVAIDGYLKGTSATRLDTYLYPPRPLAADQTDATMLIITQDTLDLLGIFAGTNQDPAKGFIGLIVQDGNGTATAGATVTINPMGTATILYADGGLPSSSATATDDSGTVFIANVNVGDITVDGVAPGAQPLHEHTVNVRAGVITTTLLDP